MSFKDFENFSFIFKSFSKVLSICQLFLKESGGGGVGGSEHDWIILGIPFFKDFFWNYGNQI